MNYPGYVFRCLRHDGFDPEALLDGTGLTEDHLSDPYFRCPMQPISRFLLNAIEQTADPHLGVRLARRYEPTFVGLPAYAAMNAPRFSESLGVLGHFFSLSFPPTSSSRYPVTCPASLREKQRSDSQTTGRPSRPWPESRSSSRPGISQQNLARNEYSLAACELPRNISSCWNCGLSSRSVIDRQATRADTAGLGCTVCLEENQGLAGRACALRL